MADLRITVAGTVVPVTLGPQGPRGEPGADAGAVGLATELNALTIDATSFDTSGFASLGIGGGRYHSDALATADNNALYPLFVRAKANGWARLDHHVIGPEQGGWEDGEADSGQIITDAFKYQRAMDLALGDGASGTIELVRGRTYLLDDLVDQEVGTTFELGDGKLLMPPGAKLKGNGATLRPSTQGVNNPLIRGTADFLLWPEVVGAVATGDTTNTSTTVDITAVTAGELVVGRPISGSGIPAGARIASFGTFDGVTGTIVISAAATATAADVALTVGMSAGENEYTLATSAEAVDVEAARLLGAMALWRMGSASWDTQETLNWAWARIVSVDTVAGTVTLDRSLEKDWDGTGEGNPVSWPESAHNKRLYIGFPLSGEIIDDLNLEPVDEATPSHRGLAFYGGRDLRIGSVRGRFQRHTTLTLQFIDGFDVGFVAARQSPETAANQGYGMRTSESRGRIGQLLAVDCHHYDYYVEFASNVKIDRFHGVVNNRDDSDSGGEFRHRCIGVTGNSHVHVNDFFAQGYGNFLCYEETHDGVFKCGKARVQTAVACDTYPVPGHNCDRLEICLNGVEELYLGHLVEEVTQTLLLDDNKTVDMNFGPGLPIEVKAWFGNGAVQGDLTTLGVGRSSSRLNCVSLAPSSASDVEVDLITAYSYGSIVAGAKPRIGAGGGDPGWTYRTEDAIVRVVTPNVANLRGSGKFIRVRMKMLRNQLAAALQTYSNARFNREVSGVEYESQATSTLNSSIAAGAQVSQTVTLTGVAAGDMAEASLNVALNADLVKTVEAVTNGVKVTITNNSTTTARTGPAGTLFVKARKRRLGA